MKTHDRFLNKLRVLYQKIRLLILVGTKNYFRYQSAKDGDRVNLRLKGHSIFIRKGTPDFEVVISCLLLGEFDDLSTYIDRNFNGVIIDAGGYIGVAALALSDMFPRAQIISIEPSKENFKFLELNVVKKPNIRPVYGALVGREVDVVKLKNRGTGEWGFTAVSRPLDNPSAEILHDSPAFTLKKLVRSASEIGILKLDIEGGELDLFTNDPTTLKSIKVLVAELHDRIVSGCTEAFNTFSQDRVTFKGRGEKYFSVQSS